MNKKYTYTEKFHYALKRSKGIPVHINLKDYMDFAAECKEIDLTEKNSDELRRLFRVENPALFYAVVSEATYRTTGMRPYPEQLAAGKLLSECKIIQMQTGEGKTLAAVFPALINARKGKHTHIFTANEYLAGRDAVWMQPVYSFFDVTSSFVTESSSNEEKITAYNSMITYVTAKQAGFDYLNDCLILEGPKLIKHFQSCIIDEADCILIDEARIPLVIAGDSDSQSKDIVLYDSIASDLIPGEDYRIDPSGRKCFLLPAGIKRTCEILKFEELTQEGIDAVSGVNVALHAQNLLKLNVDYIIRDGSVELVDGLTGRTAEKREWPYGIQRAIEAKEKIAVKPSGEIRGIISIENFINLYESIAAMTATAETSAREFYEHYGLETYILPEHRICIREDLPDVIFRTKKAKYEKLVNLVKEVSAKLQPVLIGTSSVLESKQVSDLLSEHGVKHEVLNAVQDAREAEIIAEAGMPGAITVSTNMAGRGTDIILGGTGKINDSLIRKTGGLFVIGLNRHESKRIDNQLRGRGGRQGDPGISVFLLSLEDELFVRYGIKEFIPDTIMNFSGEEPLSNKKVSREIERAQEIIDDQYSKMRGTLRNYSIITEKHRRILVELRTDALENGEFPEEIAVTADQQKVTAETAAWIFAIKLDNFWKQYIAWTEDVREGIYLRRLGNQEPLSEFCKDADSYFYKGIKSVISETAELICSRSVDELDMYIKNNRTGSTWTYIIDDNPYASFTLGLLGLDKAVGAAAAAVLALFSPLLLYNWIRKKILQYIKKD